MGALITERRVAPEEWRAERLRTIGGSDAAAAIGRGRWKSATPRALYDRMHRVIVERQEPPLGRLNDDMRRGERFEPLALKLLAAELGEPLSRHPKTTLITNDAYPWAHVAPDALRPNGRYCEVKVPRPATVARVLVHGLPSDWETQLQHACAVTDQPAITFAMLDPMSAQLHWFDVERNDAAIAEIMAGERDFYSSVLRSLPPDETEPEEDAYDGAIRNVELLDDEASNLAETYFRLRDIIGEAGDTMRDVVDKLRGMAAEPGAHTQRLIVPGVGKFVDVYTRGRRTFRADKALELLQAWAARLEEPFDPDALYTAGKPGRSVRAYQFDGEYF